jgi:hypothetical protein
VSRPGNHLSETENVGEKSGWLRDPVGNLNWPLVGVILLAIAALGALSFGFSQVRITGVEHHAQHEAEHAQTIGSPCRSALRGALDARGLSTADLAAQAIYGYHHPASPQAAALGVMKRDAQCRDQAIALAVVCPAVPICRDLVLSTVGGGGQRSSPQTGNQLPRAATATRRRRP